MDDSFIELEWSTVSFEGRRQIDITRNDASIEQREHSISYVVLSDRWWVCEGVVSEVLRQDSLGSARLLLGSLSYAQLFKFHVADTTLTSAVFELVGLRQSELGSDQVVAIAVFRVTRQERVLVLCHLLFERLVDFCHFRLGRINIYKTVCV